jgi:hypothetical protein
MESKNEKVIGSRVGYRREGRLWLGSWDDVWMEKAYIKCRGADPRWYTTGTQRHQIKGRMDWIFFFYLSFGMFLFRVSLSLFHFCFCFVPKNHMLYFFQRLPVVRWLHGPKPRSSISLSPNWLFQILIFFFLLKGGAISQF